MKSFERTNFMSKIDEEENSNTKTVTNKGLKPAK